MSTNTYPIEKPEVLTRRDFWSASLLIDGPGPVNLSGIAHSLAALTGYLWKEPTCQGTEWVNNHPLVRVYVRYLGRLSGAFTMPERSARDQADEQYVSDMLALFDKETHQ